MDNDKLLGYRSQIDSVDAEILQVLVRRFELVKEIGKLKRELGLPALDEARWAEVLRNKIEVGMDAGLGVDLIIDVFNAIHREALKQEGSIIE